MRLVVCALSIGLALRPALVLADEPRVAEAREMRDFAEGLRLAIQPQLSVQTLLVPLAVYRGMRPAHDDLAVFNAAGEPVAFALRGLHAETRRHEEEVPVPVFPVHEPERGTERAASVRLHVERDAAGSIVDIDVPDAERRPVRAKVVAYVFDASKLQRPAVRLKLALELGAGSFVTRVHVEASDDLSAWSPVATGAVVGQLAHAGQSIQRAEVELSPARAAFLRLRWEGSVSPVVRGAVVVVTREQVERTPALEHVTIDAARTAEHVYRLDLGGIVPVVQVAPRLPADSLIAGVLSAATEPEQALVPLFTGQFYRLTHDGSELSSPAVDVGGRRARYLTLRVDPRTDTLPSKLPIDVAYAPEQLLFVRRGVGPYVLAFGSYKQAAPAFAAEQLLAFMPEAARAALPRESARVSGRVALGGAAARRKPPPPRSYRLQVLWAVLIAGAGTLVLLALRLLRRMQR